MNNWNRKCSTFCNYGK